MEEIRVLLVDDYQPFLNTLADCLSTDNRFRIVGRASSGLEALNEASRLRPELILMDVIMPSMDGIEATRRLKSGPEAPRIILLTMEPDSARETTARSAGADAVMFKYEVDRRLLPLLSQMYPVPGRRTGDNASPSDAIRDYVHGQLAEFERHLKTSQVPRNTIDLWVQGARGFAKFLFEKDPAG